MTVWVNRDIFVQMFMTEYKKQVTDCNNIVVNINEARALLSAIRKNSAFNWKRGFRSYLKKHSSAYNLQDKAKVIETFLFD